VDVYGNDDVRTFWYNTCMCFACQPEVQQSLKLDQSSQWRVGLQQDSAFDIWSDISTGESKQRAQESSNERVVAHAQVRTSRGSPAI
jgi:hypothetical protein